MCSRVLIHCKLYGCNFQTEFVIQRNFSNELLQVSVVFNARDIIRTPTSFSFLQEAYSLIRNYRRRDIARKKKVLNGFEITLHELVLDRKNKLLIIFQLHRRRIILSLKLRGVMKIFCKITPLDQTIFPCVEKYNFVFVLIQRNI